MNTSSAAGSAVDSAAVEAYLRGLQQRICDAVETLEGDSGERFVADAWQKPPDSPLQGCGETRVLNGGRIFERAGVAFSEVRGSRLPPSATQNRPELAGRGFRAMGVSRSEEHTSELQSLIRIPYAVFSLK